VDNTAYMMLLAVSRPITAWQNEVILQAAQ